MNDPSRIPPPAAKNYLVTTPADRDTVRIRADKLSFGGFHFKDVGLTLNVEKPGLLGLDAGGSAISTWYYPHLLTDAKGTRLSGVLSTNPVAPAAQDGFTVNWRGGCIYNNAAGDFYRVLHNGDVWQYDEGTAVAPFRELNRVAGVAAWTIQAIAMQPPALWGGIVHLHAEYFCSCVGDDWLVLRPNGANWGVSSAGRLLRFRSIAVGVWAVGQARISTDASGQIQWRSTHAAGGSLIDLQTTGYEDPLFK